MKNILYISLFLIFQSCSIHHEFVLNNDNCYFNNSFFQTENTLKRIDAKDLISKIGYTDFVEKDNSEFKNRYYKSDVSITNKQTEKIFNIQKLIKYDLNGRIKFSYFIFLNGDAKIGNETFYDEQGNVLKTIDHEKGYNICWLEAIEIVKKIAKKDIKKYEVTDFNLSRTDLIEFPNENPEWNVSLYGNEEYEERDKKVYVIDGRTGKFLRTFKIRRP